MRAPIRTLLPTLVLSLAACVSGRTIYVGEPAPVQPPTPRPVAVMKPAPMPAPAPVPQPREALEVTLGRPGRGQLPIQLSRPSYVAIFEIVPNQGVTLVQPTATQRRRVTQAGVSAVGTWWSDRRGANETQPSRFIYVVAADQPLRLNDQAYQSDYWQRALGVSAYRGTNLYATMRAISRVVVPAVTEQDWAEDMLAVAPTYARQSPQQIPSARVFCPDGSVREVPLDFADRAICPMRVGSNDQGRLTRPDSAFDNGRRVDARAPRGPVRVGNPNDPHYGARNDVPRGRPTTKPSTPATPVTPAPARPPRRDNPATHPTPTPDDKHEAKREEQEQKREARDERKDAKSAEQEARKADREERQDAKKEEQAERKDERAEARDARTEAKADAKEERQDAKEERQDAKEERKDAKEERKDAKEERKDAKPEPKDEAREEQKDSARDDKGEAREEQKADKQPESERRGQGRPSQAGKPNKKS